MGYEIYDIENSPIADKISRNLGLSLQRMHKLSHTSKRSVWTDFKVVIKISKNNVKIKNSPFEELYWASKIGELIYVEKPLQAGVIDSHIKYTLWEWLPGMQVESTDAYRMGMLFRKLHDLTEKKESIHETEDQLARSFINLGTLANHDSRKRLKKLLHTAEKILEKYETTKISIIHGDAHEGNILNVDNRLCLIDFDSSSWGDRRTDIASSVYGWRYHRKDETAVKDFLEGYGFHEYKYRKTIEDLVWVRCVRSTCTRLAGKYPVESRISVLENSIPEV